MEKWHGGDWHVRYVIGGEDVPKELYCKLHKTHNDAVDEAIAFSGKNKEFFQFHVSALAFKCPVNQADMLLQTGLALIKQGDLELADNFIQLSLSFARESTKIYLTEKHK